MAKRPIPTEFIIDRDENKCISCQACVRMCSNEVHSYDPETNEVLSDSLKCVGCHFCESICPTHAITIKRSQSEFKMNANWSAGVITNIVKQAETGGVLLTGMGSDKKFPIYWDHILLNASQVTNPSIDPLREPMELRTYIGQKPDRIQLKSNKQGKLSLESRLSPQLQLEVPI